MTNQPRTPTQHPGKPALYNGPSFALNVPALNQTENVNYRDPPTGTSADDNYACEVSGSMSEGDCTFGGIWVWNSASLSSLTGQALSDKIQTDGVPCESAHINDNGQWFFDESSSPRVPAFLGDNFADRTNYIAAVAIFEDTSGCTAPPTGLLVPPRAWTATKCMGCPVSAARPANVARTASTANPHLVAPTIDGDWLHYAINVEQRVNHFRLLNRAGDDLLSASEIAVAAQVQWRPSPNRELVIRDPQGISDCRIRDSVGSRRPLMRFQGLPKFSLVLWQPTVPHPTVVTSQSRTNPLEMSLDPGREIIVELNDNNQSLLDNEGTIDLWVKLPGIGG